MIAAARVGFGALSPRLTAFWVALALLVVAGCGGDDGDEKTGAALPAGCTRVSVPEPRQVNLEPPPATPPAAASATVETSCGSFTIALDTARAPRTASSFAYLARQGVYDDTLIHRIIPGFVVQGGDPAGSGTGGPGYTIDEQPPRNLSYTRGIVAMAKSPVEPPGRSGSQFFVVTGADAGLTPDYALLGRVTRGLDVVQRIEQLGTASGRPKMAVIIRRVTLQSG
jgi:peptidyl-prolyl cis-trans isomerase B (cyclophilin B)